MKDGDYPPFEIFDVLTNAETEGVEIPATVMEWWLDQPEAWKNVESGEKHGY